MEHVVNPHGLWEFEMVGHGSYLLFDWEWSILFW